MSSAKPTPSKTPKKANLSDPHAVKHMLDESVTEIVTGQGYTEDTRLSNIRLFIGVIIIGIALFAQFYKKKFPANRDILIVCIVLYVIFNGLLQLIIYTKEKNAILFTHRPAGSFNSTGLVISSKLPRFSDLYTLTVASADPKAVSAHPPVQFTQSVTKWFTRDGVLVEAFLSKDVLGLVDQYSKNERKSK